MTKQQRHIPNTFLDHEDWRLSVTAAHLGDGLREVLVRKGSQVVTHQILSVQMAAMVISGWPANIEHFPVPGPDDGHLFRLSMDLRGSSMVVGDEHHTDDPNWSPDPWTIEVRAWSLREAIAKIHALPLCAWTTGEETDLADEAAEV